MCTICFLNIVERLVAWLNLSLGYSLPILSIGRLVCVVHAGHECGKYAVNIFPLRFGFAFERARAAYVRCLSILNLPLQSHTQTYSQSCTQHEKPIFLSLNVTTIFFLFTSRVVGRVLYCSLLHSRSLHNTIHFHFYQLCEFMVFVLLW